MRLLRCGDAGGRSPSTEDPDRLLLFVVWLFNQATVNDQHSQHAFPCFAASLSPFCKAKKSCTAAASHGEEGRSRTAVNLDTSINGPFLGD